MNYSRRESPNQSQVRLRIAQLEDAGTIARLVNQAFQVERFFIDGERTNPDAVRELLGKGKFLLAEEDGMLAACVYLEPRGARCYLGLLSVDPGR
jgi:N-acetylglutamate synthase-like GNAT family acetyltransferase